MSGSMGEVKRRSQFTSLPQQDGAPQTPSSSASAFTVETPVQFTGFAQKRAAEHPIARNGSASAYTSKKHAGDDAQHPGSVPKASSIQFGATSISAKTESRTSTAYNMTTFGGFDATGGVLPFGSKEWSAGTVEPKTRKSIHLLAGDAIEVVVGHDTLDSRTVGQCKTWWLPRDLLVHYSSFFETVYPIEFARKPQNCVPLESVDPAIFALFVEWLYYGSYAAGDVILERGSKHSAAWVLGAKLKTPAFQNYAMDRLYTVLNGMVSLPVTPEELGFAFTNCATGTPLPKLYLDLLSQHFGNSARVKGTATEWDGVLQEHANARIVLLQRLGCDPKQRAYVKEKGAYMVKEEVPQGAPLDTSLFGPRP